MLFWYVPYLVISPSNLAIQSLRYDSNVKNENLPSFQKVYVISDDIRLVGNLLVSVPESRAVFVLLHGIAGSKERWIDVQNYLAANNISSLAIDLRGHGESEGKFTTFGSKESQDLSKWIELIENQETFDSIPIGVMGHSLGAATSILSLASDKRLRFGVIISSFSTLEETFQDYTKHFVGFNFPFLTRYLLSRSSELADFSPEKVKPIESCKLISQPIYFAHGTKDRKIPIRYGFENYQVVPHTKKEFHPILGANHDDVIEVGDTLLLNDIIRFLESEEAF